MLAGLALAASSLWASAPERVLRLEAGILDAPIEAEREAEAALTAAERAGDSARRYDAALRLALAAAASEHLGRAASAAVIAASTGLQRDDEVGQCLLAYQPVMGDDLRSSQLVMRMDQELARARRRGADWCVARLQAQRGQLFDRLGRRAEAIEAQTEALRLFEQAGEEGWVGNLQSTLAWLYSHHRDDAQSLQRAVTYGEAAVGLAERRGLRSLEAVARHNVAGAYMALKRDDEAHRHLARALELARSIGDRIGTAYIARLQGRVELNQHRPQAALPLYAQAQAIFMANGDADMELVCRLGRILALQALSNWQEMRRELDAARPLLSQSNDGPSRVDFHRASMQLLEAQGDLAGALAASKAWAAAIQDSVRDENRKLSAELQERFETARKEAENLHLRELQASAAGRMQQLVLTLGLALALIGGLVLHGVWQRRVRRRLRDLAERDELTQLPNRRTILAHARLCVAAASGPEDRVALAVFDLDHFKSINDRFGHDAGDQALRLFAAISGQVLRRQDRIGRLGGEEFLGVFPDAEAAQLSAIFERLRDALRAAPLPGLPQEVRLSFSMGAVVAVRGDDVDELVRRADQALYEAKAQGRDRFSLAPN